MAPAAESVDVAGAGRGLLVEQLPLFGVRSTCRLCREDYPATGEPCCPACILADEEDERIDAGHYGALLSVMHTIEGHGLPV